VSSFASTLHQPRFLYLDQVYDKPFDILHFAIDVPLASVSTQTAYRKIHDMHIDVVDRASIPLNFCSDLMQNSALIGRINNVLTPNSANVKASLLIWLKLSLKRCVRCVRADLTLTTDNIWNGMEWNRLFY